MQVQIYFSVFLSMFEMFLYHQDLWSYVYNNYMYVVCLFKRFSAANANSGLLNFAIFSIKFLYLFITNSIMNSNPQNSNGMTIASHQRKFEQHNHHENRQTDKLNNTQTHKALKLRVNTLERSAAQQQRGRMCVVVVRWGRAEWNESI